jgi:hypothetical protein
VAPSAYARAHRQHVNALIRNQVPDRAVALVDPEDINVGMRDYLILEHAAPRTIRPLAASQRQHEAAVALQSQSQVHSQSLNQAHSQSQASIPVLQPLNLVEALSNSQQADSVGVDAPGEQHPNSQQVQTDPSLSQSAQPARRQSTRTPRPKSFGNDFIE